MGLRSCGGGRRARTRGVRTHLQTPRTSSIAPATTSRRPATSRRSAEPVGHAPGRIRTFGLALRRRALYPLSYGRGEVSVVDVDWTPAVTAGGRLCRPGGQGRSTRPRRAAVPVGSLVDGGARRDRPAPARRDVRDQPRVAGLGGRRPCEPHSRPRGRTWRGGADRPIRRDGGIRAGLCRAAWPARGRRSVRARGDRGPPRRDPRRAGREGGARRRPPRPAGQAPRRPGHAAPRASAREGPRRRGRCGSAIRTTWPVAPSVPPRDSTG